MSVTSLIAITFGVAFFAYGAWVLTYAYRRNKEEKLANQSTDDMVDGLRKNFHFSA